jgi:hypothetical protein
MPYDGGEYGRCILSRWPLEQVGNVELPAGTLEPRTTLMATLHPDTFSLRSFLVQSGDRACTLTAGRLYFLARFARRRTDCATEPRAPSAGAPR